MLKTGITWSERAIFGRKNAHERPWTQYDIYAYVNCPLIGGRYERATAGTHSYGVHSN